MKEWTYFDLSSYYSSFLFLKLLILPIETSLETVTDKILVVIVAVAVLYHTVLRIFIFPYLPWNEGGAHSERNFSFSSCALIAQ